LKAKISKVADIPTFTWFDTMSKVSQLPGYLTAAGSQILQIVVYDLPNRDCHANASNGELFYNQNGAALYQQYVDGIVAAVKAAPGSTVVAVVEPDSLANLVTNLSDSRCSSVQDQYKASVTYALKALSSAGIYSYMDAGHAGWLGWPANISPAATMFTQIWTNAGKSSYIRGLATNVANYNALSAASPDPVTQGNNNYDEIHYINALAPMLSSGGWSAKFLVDQGRSGKQNIRSAWGNWCNIKNAGFGTRPTTSTGSEYIDAIVWVKPGGESDGTSNTSATRYDSMCGGTDAKIPAPEAGQWFQAYFVDLVNNASPSL
jgi:cellulose 1,4-beta-cellobiosidase